MNVFDYLGSINYTKQNIMKDDMDERVYVSFIINRSLSYFPDTVAFANELNRYHHIDNKLQYDFLLNIVRKRQRFSKWTKADVLTDIDIVKQYYGYSNEKARQVLSLLSKEHLALIEQKVSKGGRYM